MTKGRRFIVDISMGDGMCWSTPRYATTARHALVAALRAYPFGDRASRTSAVVSLPGSDSFVRFRRRGRASQWKFAGGAMIEEVMDGIEITRAEYARLAAMWQRARDKPTAVTSPDGERYTVVAAGAPYVGQQVRHKSLAWTVDTIYPHPTQPGRFDCDIVRGCCVAQIIL